MAKVSNVDPELTELIEEVISAQLLAPDSTEVAIARRVAENGRRSLDPTEHEIWERSILPILSKSIHDQVAIASIVRRGGYVPRRIGF